MDSNDNESFRFYSIYHLITADEFKQKKHPLHSASAHQLYQTLSSIVTNIPRAAFLVAMS